MKIILESLEKSLVAEAWYPSLFLALTIPDICAKIDNLALKTSGKMYAEWFDKYVAPKYQHSSGDGTIVTFLGGADCYALRCAALHEGSDDITAQKARESLDSFVFVAPPEGWLLHCNISNSKLNLQVNIFCRDIAAGVWDWLRAVEQDESKQSEILKLLSINLLEDGNFKF